MGGVLDLEVLAISLDVVNTFLYCLRSYVQLVVYYP